MNETIESIVMVILLLIIKYKTKQKKIPQS